jgi:hypothetical protein
MDTKEERTTVTVNDRHPTADRAADPAKPHDPAPTAGCCDAATQSRCCEASSKPTCCGSDRGSAGGCGCQ